MSDKRFSIKCLLLALILAFACTATACSYERPQYTVEYIAEEGGVIIGQATQVISRGKSGSEVKAAPLYGYKFTGWSDGKATVNRTDRLIRKNKTVYACFEGTDGIVTYTANNYRVSNLEHPLRTKLEGDELAEVEIIPNLGYKFVGWSDGVTTPARSDNHTKAGKTITAILEEDSLGLPSMIVRTENRAEINSKETYVPCTVTISGTQQEYALDNASAGIRGRGNSTWGMPKKPYRIKFDTKTDLFGSGSAKKWVLLANYCDPSMVRNHLAFTLGGLFDTQKNLTTTSHFVDLYLNDEYVGVYQVCEQVEAGKNRVNISEKLDTLDTGYLLELDVRIEGSEGHDYFAIYDDYFGRRCYQLKSPDVEDVEAAGLAPEDFVEFIGSYVRECMDALHGDDFGAVCELLDMDSFVESYIVNELFNSQDIGDSSFFLYKQAGGKLCVGPLWDYDISTGNCEYGSSFYKRDLSSNPKAQWARQLNMWYYYLMTFNEFRTLVAQKFSLYSEAITAALDACIQDLYLYEESFSRNYLRWQTLGKYVWPNPHEVYKLKTWKAHVEYTRTWLGKSYDAVKNYFAKYLPDETN